jgi:uncharacterized protein (DUF302 family)
MGYGRSVVVDRPFAEALAATREALAGQGFGVLTEIDMAATLKKKLGVDIPPQVILGACNPPLAHRALVAEESVGLLLPCNVVVRLDEDGRTVVETLDPQVMVTLTGNPRLASIAQDAAERLATVLVTVQSPAS